jgi:hypothetical protein
MAPKTLDTAPTRPSNQPPSPPITAPPTRSAYGGIVAFGVTAQLKPLAPDEAFVE